jgi:long-chain acyl-CoA synthetase
LTSCCAGLQARPDEVALVSAERALTWRELDEESARLAGGYRGIGLAAGDRLASLMPNRIDLVVHYLACFRARSTASA